MAQAGSGGGITMNKNVSGKVAGGARSADVVNPGALSEYGTAVGGRLNRTGSYTNQSVAKNMFDGTKSNPAPFGNAKALDVGPGGGVGTGRTIYRSGSQTQHGASVAGNAPQGRPIWPEFPPETSSQGSLVRKR